MNNQKYTLLSFLPKVLYNEFKFFFNMFFLIIALSQFIPFLKVGLLITYIAPLVFVLFVTMLKEAYDDILRMLRDRELNLTKYEFVTQTGLRKISAQDIRVGHIIKVHKDQRLPADLLLLKASGTSGSIFIRTD